ncbi:mediator of RNA polymerase II transcription subunit 18-like [Oscarella lobularis]|uniref:mediator of RNA polymerase II transcription subunit 18-like n=1 Tax=Oscarella lobularis TaxID=121494 RepID=UPI0033144F13
MNSREFRALGRVGADNVEAVLHRLRGVCDNAAVGGAPFRERELYYQIKSATSSLSLIARKSLLDEKSPWDLRYYGPVESSRTSPVQNRSCIQAATSEQLPQFLQEMGFLLQNELEFEGFCFLKGKYKVSLYKVIRINTKGDKQEAGQARIFEFSTVVSTGQGQEATVAEMNAFIDHLKPLVNFHPGGRAERGDAGAAS